VKTTSVNSGAGGSSTVTIVMIVVLLLSVLVGFRWFSGVAKSLIPVRINIRLNPTGIQRAAMHNALLYEHAGPEQFATADGDARHRAPWAEAKLTAHSLSFTRAAGSKSLRATTALLPCSFAHLAGACCGSTTPRAYQSCSS
jgi:hypothetical protein